MRRILLAAVMFGAASGAQAADLPISSARLLHRRADDPDGQLAGLLRRRPGRLRFVQYEFSSGIDSARSQSNLLSAHGRWRAYSRFRPGRSWGRSHVHGSGYGGVRRLQLAMGRRRPRRRSELHAWQVRRTPTDSMVEIVSRCHPAHTNSDDLFGSASIKRYPTMASLRARAGYAWGAFLPYAFGGAATRTGQHHPDRPHFRSRSTRHLRRLTSAVRCQRDGRQDSKLIYGYSVGLGVDVS